MRILFDHNVDRRFRRHLPGHQIRTTRESGWEKLENGLLLRSAAEAGFEAFVSLDKKLEYQQNLQSLPLPVVIVDSSSNALSSLLPFAGPILELLNSPLRRALYIIEASGTVVCVTAPRS